MAIRARADGSAAKVYAEAYDEDPGFYMFMRGLQTVETLLDDGSVLVVDSEGPLFEALTGAPLELEQARITGSLGTVEAQQHRHRRYG